MDYIKCSREKCIITFNQHSRENLYWNIIHTSSNSNRRSMRMRFKDFRLYFIEITWEHLRSTFIWNVWGQHLFEMFQCLNYKKNKKWMSSLFIGRVFCFNFVENLLFKWRWWLGGSHFNKRRMMTKDKHLLKFL